jgi:hypothetical protein
MPTPSAEAKAKFQPILHALKAHRARIIADHARVLAVRPGYVEVNGEHVPGLVVAVVPGTSFDVDPIAQVAGVPVEVTEATPQEQLRESHERGSMSDFEVFLRAQSVVFGPPRRGTYEPPDDTILETIDDVMDVEISASPDVGWTVLRDFLQGGVKKSLTIGIYQFTAPHIYKQLRKTMLAAPRATLAICRQSQSEPIPESGTKSEDLEGDIIVQRLDRALGSRFDFVRASTGSGGAFTKSYHIKVAVADERRFWLSSGNMQSSNQSPFDPIGDPDSLPRGYDTKYNREYHAVVEHRGLARVFERYLDWDRELPGVASFAATASGPDLILPVEIDDLRFAATERFLPLRLQDEQVKVTPVLTPDNYASVVVDMLASAEQSIDLQNQYIDILAGGNLPEFDALLEAILERAAAGVRIRLLLRSYMTTEKIDMLVSMGFKRSWFRLMKNCHAKLIVVDRQKALVGSHNWSNGGTVTNRDASLLFEHEGIARYLGDIFEHDWTHRGSVPRSVRQPRIARFGDPGAVNSVPWESVYDEGPGRPVTLAPVVSTPLPVIGAVPGAISFAPGAGAKDEDLVVPFGVNGATGERLYPPISAPALVERIKIAGMKQTDAEKALGRTRAGESFDLRFGTNPNDLKSAGWAVIWGIKTPKAVRERFVHLIEHRRKQMSARFFREIEARADETVAEFLTRHNVAFGDQRPTRLPYYLLIVASPEDVSYELQYGLGLEYAVGRIWFEDANGAIDEDAFAAYASSLVEFETNGTGARPKQVAFWAPRHRGDRATELSSTELVGPLVDGAPDLEPIAKIVGAEVVKKFGPDATFEALEQLLTDPAAPALLFTAGHGMGFDKDDPSKQRRLQGALLTGRFKGFGSIAAEDYLAADSLPAGASAAGLVAFLFACFGAGTPKINSYLDDRGLGSQVAEAPFVAALPQALLRRGALAVIGHVDLAWAFSFRPLDAKSSMVGPFENTVGGLLTGQRVGHATRALNNRAMRLAAELAELLMPGAPAADGNVLALRWLERNDARAYVLVGDPAAHLTFA